MFEVQIKSWIRVKEFRQMMGLYETMDLLVLACRLHDMGMC